MSSESTPRLPVAARAPIEPEPIVRRTLPLVDDYVPPEIVPIDVPRRFVQAVRWVLVLWSLTLVAVAWGLRTSAEDGPVVRTRLEVVGGVGFGVLIATLAAGWWWSIRLATNVDRLDGRTPTRARCVRAWAAPVFWALVMWGTVLQLGPTEILDVRPLIVAIILALAVWRPYALVRRILQSLSRVRSDVLIGTGYLLDLAAFGTIWWRFTAWPEQLGPDEIGATDSSIGLLFAAAVALLVNAFVWGLLVRVLSSALVHRRIAHRTRHEHRQLRLRGIDPMAPEVRWALHELRLQEYRSGLAEDGADGEDDGDGEEGAVPPADQASVTDEPTVPFHPRSVPFDVRDVDEPGRGSDDGALPPEPDLDRFRQRLQRATGRGVGGDTVDAVDEVDAVDDEPSSPAGSTEAAEEPAAPVDDDPGSSPTVVDDSEPEVPVAGDPEPAATLDGVRPQRSTDAAPEERFDRLLRRARDDQGGDRPGRRGALDRVAERLGALSDETEHPSLERLASRLGQDGHSRGDIVERLAAFGITPDTDPSGVDDVPDVDDSRAAISRRAHSLEFARYMMLLALAGSAAAAGWLVLRSSTASVVDGDIAPFDVDRIDVARVVMIAALDVALFTVAAWTLVAIRWMRRVGVDVGRTMPQALAGTVVTAGAALAGVLLDVDRGALSFSLTALAALAAMYCLTLMRRLQADAMQTTSSLAVWSAVLLLVPLTIWSARLDRPTATTDALESITFFSAIEAIMLGLCVLLAAVASRSIEERVRLIPMN